MNHNVYQIKQKLVEIIRNFANAYLSEADIRINELNRNTQSEYAIKGEYSYKTFTGNTIEKGTFEVTLGKNLEILAGKVTKA